MTNGLFPAPGGQGNRSLGIRRSAAERRERQRRRDRRMDFQEREQQQQEHDNTLSTTTQEVLDTIEQLSDEQFLQLVQRIAEVSDATRGVLIRFIAGRANRSRNEEEAEVIDLTTPQHVANVPRRHPRDPRVRRQLFPPEGNTRSDSPAIVESTVLSARRQWVPTIHSFASDPGHESDSIPGTSPDASQEETEENPQEPQAPVRNETATRCPHGHCIIETSFPSSTTTYRASRCYRCGDFDIDLQHWWRLHEQQMENAMQELVPDVPEDTVPEGNDDQQHQNLVRVQPQMVCDSQRAARRWDTASSRSPSPEISLQQQGPVPPRPALQMEQSPPVSWQLPTDEESAQLLAILAERGPEPSMPRNRPRRSYRQEERPSRLYGPHGTDRPYYRRTATGGSRIYADELRQSPRIHAHTAIRRAPQETHRQAFELQLAARGRRSRIGRGLAQPESAQGERVQTETTMDHQPTEPRQDNTSPNPI